MAFTEDQVAAICEALGKPIAWQQQDPALFSILLLVAQSASYTAKVVGYLAQIQTVVSQISTVAHQSMGVQGLGHSAVELYDNNMQYRGLCDEGQMYCNQLSNFLGIPISNKMFGRSGYSGHGWASGQMTPANMGDRPFGVSPFG